MQGIILAMRAMAAAGATRIVCPNAVEPWDISLDPEADPQAQQQRLEDLFARMREVGINKYELPLFSAHQTGSCRMGACSRCVTSAAAACRATCPQLHHGLATAAQQGPLLVLGPLRLPAA